ncbi:membrane protein [Variovorax paradoxus]|uniref:Membrane protein n=2 Tax=Variovorax paradoxus TaxID=34073 RepID=A0A0D0ME45_VARPD|nr:membrane protein [Variovorax paradoxus]
MKRVALGLLCAAALLYAVASALHAQHPAWGYVAAFAEAAMVGAIADWFAVVALFRHPLGLPIPHTAIIPSNKDRIGAKLAGFICNNFLSTAQVLAKLREFDTASRIADWLARPASGQKLGEWGVAATRYGLAAFDDDRVRDFMGRAAAAGLAKIDLSRLTGQALDALTAGGRHQALLDDVLQQVAGLLEGDEVQAHITEAIAREIKTLRYVGLDQVAAKLATRKIVAAVAHTIGELAAEPDHPMRKRFDHFVDDFVVRLKLDPEFQQRGEQIRAELMAHPALGDYLHGLWGELLAWLDADLRRSDSTIRQRIASMAGALGTRLQADEAIRRWINEQIEAAAPLAIERYREDIRRYIEERVGEWNAQEMTLELERHIGRDLQFIRINGTLVGGLVGLLIHTVTQLLRG